MTNGPNREDMSEELPAISGRQVFSREYEAAIDHTLNQLRERLRGQETALQELRDASRTPAIQEPSADPRTRLRQIQTFTAAYERLTPAEPTLPAPDSPLPALLMLRHSHRLIAETARVIADDQKALSAARNRLAREEADLRDAHLMTRSLESRISSLEASQQDDTEVSSAKAAKHKLQELQKRRKGYERETKALVKALNDFFDDHLASMLAAEELGGPVVGEMMDVDDEVLGAGFSHQGRTRKTTSARDPSKRQRRIDHIWGATDADDGEHRTESDAAAAEMRTLLEDLYNASASAGGSSSGAYVGLSRESAAARFLIRAKVAQFHPRDARRLRLIDFARGLDG
ncbi:MAG: hypothetical protein M1817_002176 [Caeruleum heppii]|nr:MAG: hypothetical protein M1817_002176 [Caeruleum heppii]